MLRKYTVYNYMYSDEERFNTEATVNVFRDCGSVLVNLLTEVYLY